MKKLGLVVISLLITLVTFVVPSPVLPIFKNSFFYYSYFESNQVPTDKGQGLPLAYISENTCAPSTQKPPEGYFTMVCAVRYSVLGSHNYSIIFFAVDTAFWYIVIKLFIKFFGKFIK